MPICPAFANRKTPHKQHQRPSRATNPSASTRRSATCWMQRSPSRARRAGRAPSDVPRKKNTTRTSLLSRARRASQWRGDLAIRFMTTPTFAALPLDLRKTIAAARRCFASLTALRRAPPHHPPHRLQWWRLCRFLTAQLPMSGFAGTWKHSGTFRKCWLSLSRRRQTRQSTQRDGRTETLLPHW